MPPAKGFALGVHAGEGGREPGIGVRAFHRHVGTKGQPRACDLHGMPGIGAGQSARAQSCFSHQPIARLVDRLHRGDHAQSCKAGDVGGINNLRMFNPPAPVAPIGLGHFRNRIERLRVRGIANGVHSDLKTIHGRAAHQIAQLGIVEELQPAFARLVGIRLLEPSPTGAECAIGIELDACHAQLVAIEPGRGFACRNSQHRFDIGGIAEDADVEPTGIARTAERGPILG